MKLGWMLVMCASCEFPRPQDVSPDAGVAVPDSGSPGSAPCQLAAIEPLAGANDRIYIEGTFAGSVVVNFPGSSAASATVLGSHRASVTVPASATAGDLTVTTCGLTFGPVPFRRASFELGLTKFEAIYNQSEGARETPVLQTAREGATAVVLGRYVYVVGGIGSAGALNSIERARVNADGSLGRFTTSSEVTLTTSRRAHTSVVIGGYLYVLGGFGDRPLASIERAAIGPDGSIGAFAIVPGVSLAVARQGHTSVVIGNMLYVVGGSDGAPLDSVERATINADGSLEPFSLVSNVHLVVARQDHAIAVAANFLYVVGGSGGGRMLNNVERTAIAPDGSLEQFATVPGVALATARSRHTVALFKNMLYVVGGRSDSGPLSDVEASPINSDELLGPFVAAQAAMVAPRQGQATAIVGNYLYMLGGAGSTPLASIERASLDGSGNLEPLSPFGAAGFVIPRAGFAAVVIGDYVYVIGGESTSANTIERATIRADGTLGPFGAVVGVALMTSRKYHTAAVVGSYLYIIGGMGAGGALSSVERASINPDGSLGTFAVVATLPAPRAAHTSVVIGKYLYILGGDDASNVLGSIVRATIDSDGTIGPWMTLPGVVLQIPRDGHQNFVAGSYLYVMGGNEAAIERSTISADGTLGAFGSTFVLLNAERELATTTVVGQHLYVFGGQVNASQNESEEGQFTANGLLAGVGLSSVAPVRRYGHAILLTGNYLYLLGGVDSILTQYQGIDSMLLK